MFKLNRGVPVGNTGSTEIEFEKTINFFKKAVECVEVSRTGEAGDKSLTVELRYRDFPTFSIKMDSSTYSKGRIVKIGENIPNIANLLSGSQTYVNVILTEHLFWIDAPSTAPFGMVKSNIGDFFGIAGTVSLYASEGSMQTGSKNFKTLSKCISVTGKVLVLDIFCPDFSLTSSVDAMNFEKKLLGVKNIIGFGDVPFHSRFSVDGQEYIRVTNELCIEVTP